MQQSPELNPDPLAGLVAELSKCLDGLERRLDSLERRLERMETHQREDTAALRQDMAALNRRIDWLIGLGITAFVAVTGLLVTILLKLP